MADILKGGNIPNRAGRPKGTQNKTTRLLKDAILMAAQAAGGGKKDGLVKYLTVQAKENPPAFMTLLGKVLPLQIEGGDKPFKHDHSASDALLSILDGIAERSE